MTQMMPKLSIIVPIYNIDKHIERCLTSIEEQTYKDWECIVVDDGSTDRSGDICDEWAKRDQRFHVIHQTNQGLSGARNTGLEIAIGKYIAFVDGDDYIHPNMYELMLKTAHDFDTCQLVLIRGTCVNENDRHINDLDPAPSISHLDQEQVHRITFIPYDDNSLFMGYAWNKIYRRDLIGNERYRNVVCEDMDFNLRLFPKCKDIIVVNAKAYYYRIRKDSISTSPDFLLDAIPGKCRYYIDYIEERGFDCESAIIWYLFKRILFIKEHWLNKDNQKMAFTNAAYAYHLIKHKLHILGLTRSLYIRVAYLWPRLHKIALGMRT